MHAGYFTGGGVLSLDTSFALSGFLITGLLVDELERLSLPFTDDHVPSDAELRIAQAQLVGWLEGLFHGIQATLFAQQMAAQRPGSEIFHGRMLTGQQFNGAPPGIGVGQRHEHQSRQCAAEMCVMVDATPQ